jgi:phage terminase large subunit-like protein
LPPNDEGWRVWLFLGGRGTGKTRAGAEWAARRARLGLSGRIALIGPTFHDVREVMVEGRSGIRSLPYERPVYEATRRRLLWSNGAQAFCFSAEDPEALRGPQFDAAWADELCFWAHAEETLDTLSHGLRLGERPLMLATTTPKPMKILKQLMQRRDVVITRGVSWDNAANLAKDFIAALNARWTGSAQDRQELLGEVVEDDARALWRRADFEHAYGGGDEDFDRIVVAVDPPVSVGEKADACGIVAAGASGEGLERRAVVLADASVQGVQPLAWALRVAELAYSLEADCIIAEANNGGELVRELLRQVAPDMAIKLVHARHGKRVRAEPIAALYTRGLVRHARVFSELEDEMCAFTPNSRASPDRMDALVWALTDLMLDARNPRARSL